MSVRVRRVVAVAVAFGAAALGLATRVAPAVADVAGLEVVSQASGGQPADAPSSDPTVSADGRWVAFSSTASNLAPDLNGQRHVYVRDRSTGALSRADVGVDGAGLPWSSSPDLSSDGQWLAFCGPSGTSTTSVYLRDRMTGASTVVGEASQFEGGCVTPSVTANGEKVAFWRFAPDSPDGTKVVIWDRATGTSTSVVNEITSDPHFQEVQLVAGGRVLGYRGSYLSTGTIEVLDLVTGAKVFQWNGTDADDFALSDDGTTIAYQRSVLFSDEPPHVVVRDLATGAQTQADQGPDGGSVPSLSPDARFVGYWSTVSQVLDRSTAPGPAAPSQR